jgi:long-chain fatty acid transport protein
LGLVLAVSCSVASAQGLIAPSAGPINSSMAGASTAAPTDVGASYWNPATISGLDRNEVLIGSGLIFPSIHLETGLRAGAVGGVFPPTSRFGLARSDSGVSAIPSIAVAFKLDDESPMTFGLGMFGLAGGNVNYPGSFSTPILTPRLPPSYFGFGPIYSNATVLSIDPIASFEVTDKLAIAAGPMISTGTVSMVPAFFAPGPRDANGIPTFPNATDARPFWGAGFQLGLYYELNEDWNLGFSYKSPVWQERWSYNASTPNLVQRRIGVQATIPEIFSWGVAYKGFERTLIDVDFRYFDYGNAALFGQSLASGGLGWRSVFAVALGVQYQATDRLTVRAGYLFNQNPIPTEGTLFNTQLPGIVTNTLAMGGSYRLTDDIVASLAWVHGFRNSIQGGVREEAGAFAKFDVQTDTLQFGLNIQFGGSRKKSPPVVVPAVASTSETSLSE